MVGVKVYVEGGGDYKSLKTVCRRGFQKFLESAGLVGRMPKIIACGSRKAAFDDFTVALGQYRKSPSREPWPILLVDSEAPVAVPNFDAWKHLSERKADKWRRPEGAEADQAHLMVQCMESWFFADKPALEKYFGQHFRAAALPARQQIEEIPKAAIASSLETATRDTTKGRYHKGRHSFAILAMLNPAKVADASPWAARWLKIMRDRAQ